MKKLGIALGGGGSRGIAHIGFLQALDDLGIKPQAISGCSIGSVVGSCYCMGMSPKDMYDAAMALRPRELLDPGVTALKNGTLLKSKKMIAVLRRFLGNTSFDQLKIPFACVGTDIGSGKKVVFSQGDVATAVQASSSIPFIFQAVEYQGKMVADGGVVCRVPTKEVRALGADVVVSVDILGPLNQTTEIKSIFGYMLRVIDIYDNKVNDVNIKKDKSDLYLTPDIGDMSQYKIERKKMQLAYEKGYECAVSNKEKILELIQ